jgi:ABC-type uncharacterized transport system auxiliary subunit
MIKQFVFVLLILSLTGCFGDGAVVPQDKFYRLSEVAAEKKIKSPFRVVAIERLKGDALHRERSILYSEAEQPLKLKRYHYHYWTRTPGELIREHLISYLRQSEFATRIVRYGEVAKIDAKISGQIKNFERIIDADGIKVRAHLELSLETLGNTRRYYQWEYDIQHSTTDSSMYATVTAMSSALEIIYAQFLQDISALELASQK